MDEFVNFPTFAYRFRESRPPSWLEQPFSIKSSKIAGFATFPVLFLWSLTSGALNMAISAAIASLIATVIVRVRAGYLYESAKDQAYETYLSSCSTAQLYNAARSLSMEGGTVRRIERHLAGRKGAAI